MDPLKQQQLATPIVEVFLAIEEQLLMNIAKRLRQHQALLTEDDILAWQTEQLSMLGSLTQENIITIAKHSGMAIDEVSKALEKAGYTAAGEFEGTLQEAVQMGLLIQPPTIEQSAALENILLAYQAQAKNIFNLVNTTLLQQSQQVYLDIVNQTTGKVLAGVLTPREALRETAAKWANEGVPALVDKAGRKWSTEAYMNMVIRSTVSNVANEMQMTRFQEYGVDLVEVSSHADSRPSHVPYQGRIYSISGRHPKYPPLSETGYGTIEGIGGINCRHVLYPFIEGVSKQRFFPYDVKESRKSYELSQKQRKLERDIRKAKRELSMMEALGDQEGIDAAKKKVRDKQRNMREFISSTGRTRNYQREQISPLTKKEIQGEYNKKIEKIKQNIKNKIANGEISTKINPEKQARHMIGNPAYEAYKHKLSKKGLHGPSYLTISQEEAQELVNKYAGTGDLKISKFKFQNKETIIQNDKNIGYYVDKDGNHILTSKFDIRYSKTGVHIFPSKG
jgi:Phage minor capsid protein 2/Bacterial toxin 50